MRCCAPRREMAGKYNIKYFYDIQDRSNFKANPDYKGVCHVALAQVCAQLTYLYCRTRRFADGRVRVCAWR
jgi:hypothetical protein